MRCPGGRGRDVEVVQPVQRRSGKQEVAHGGARASGTRPSSWQGGRRQGRGQAGWAAQVGWPAGPRQVGGQVTSLSLSSNLVSIFYFHFYLLKKYKRI